MNSTTTHLFGGTLFSAGLTYGDANELADEGSTTKRGRGGFAATLVATSSLVLASPALADVIHVPVDFPTIQEAIDASMNGDEIIVGHGTYEEVIDFLGKTIIVRSSGGQEVTIIDGNSAGTVVTCANGEGPGTTLRGFTVTDGSIWGPGSGGGMYIGPDSTVTVTDCAFYDNYGAYSSAGGLYNAGTVTLTNCSFSENAGYVGCGMYNSGIAVVVNCDFVNNGLGASYPFGGGLHDVGGALVVNCLFDSNWVIGGEFCCTEGGGVIGNSTLINCAFVDNYASWGGAVSGDATIINSTFVGNCGPDGGGAVFGDATIINSILWGNTPNQIQGDAGVAYSNVQGGWPGDGNIDADPLFVDPDNGDYRLGPGSPCIDAGDNTLAACLLSDLDGNERLFDDPRTRDTGLGRAPIVDMGPYEYLSPPANGGDDCNLNLLDDDCELAEGITSDCNANGLPDDCDIADGTSEDCNANGIPDECDIDCNGNGVPDECDIADGASLDCNGNGSPDECDIAGGTSQDCNGNGVPDGCEATPHTVSEDFSGAGSVYASDIDGDGDMDILGAAWGADAITWWENTTGDGSAWVEHTVDGDFSSAESVYAADVDGDGDMDVLGAAEFDDEITWWENASGDGLVWTEHTIDGDFRSAHSVYAADVDGDGDVDVLGAASYFGEIAWWENTTGDGTAWTEHPVDDNYLSAYSVYAADVDGDGDIDVLGAAFADDITWWENTVGDGRSWTEHSVADDFDGAISVNAADVDGDGDLDVLGAAFNADDISWWENTTGDGTSWTEHTVDGDFDYAKSVNAADVDGDGDVDVLGAAFLADDISWWENTAGDGTVWTEHTMDVDFDGAESVYAADVDGDGDLEVLGAAFWAGDITWWEKTPCEEINCPGDFNDNGMVGSGDLIFLLGAWGENPGHPADLDGDGNVGAADLIELLGNWGPCPK